MWVSFICHLFRQLLQQEETTAEFLSRDTDATFFFNLKWKIRQEKPELCLKDNESFVISQPSAMHNLAAEFYSQLHAAADESVLGSSKNTQSWKICTPNICSRRGSVIPGESSDENIHSPQTLHWWLPWVVTSKAAEKVTPLRALQN